MVPKYSQNNDAEKFFKGLENFVNTYPLKSASILTREYVSLQYVW